MKTKRGEEAAEEMSKANRGWFTMFKERNHIQNIKIQGEVTSVDTEPVPSDLEDLAKIINEVLVLSHSVGSNSFAAPWTARLCCPWNFPGKNTGVNCHFLLQGIFLIQGSKLHLLHFLHWQVDSLSLSHLVSPN